MGFRGKKVVILVVFRKGFFIFILVIFFFFSVEFVKVYGDCGVIFFEMVNLKF